MIRLRFRGKLLVVLLGALVIIQGSIIAHTALRVRTNSIAKTTKLLTASAEREAEELSKTMTRFVVTAQTLAASLEECNRTAPEARKDVIDMTRQILAQTPGALSAWFVFEPNAFDGKDSEFSGVDGFKETGRFEGTFVRNNGSIIRTYDTTEESLQDGDWYYGPLRSGHPMIEEPCRYSYVDNGESYLITTLSIPIKLDGKNIGVVGLDVDLAAFTEKVTAISVTEHSYNTLFSNEGYMLYHPNKNLVEKNLEEVGRGKIKNLDEILNIITTGDKKTCIEYSINLNEDILRVQTPIPLGSNLAPWSLSITVPLSDVTAAPNRLIRNLILTSLLGLVLLGLVI
ncbi:MAG: chemotaxis protein, partial [Dethiosulfovibrio peptidovorans]